MALSSVERASVRTALSVRDLFLHEPLRFVDGQSLTIQCATTPVGEWFDFKILSSGVTQPEGKWTLHASGSVMHIVQPAPQRVDLEAVKARCPLAMEGEVLYSLYAERGIQFGPLFRAVRRVQYSATELLAEIAAPNAVATQGAYCAHPALLDACLQPILALFPSGPERTIFVPSGYDSIIFRRSLAGRLWSHVMLQPVTGDRSLKADIVVTDDSGDELLQIDGLRIAQITIDQFASSHPDVAAVYHSEWLAHANVVTERLPSGAWLVLADRAGIGERLSERLRSVGAKVVVARAAEQFSNRAGEWCVRAGSANDFARLVRDAKPVEGWSGVIHCWNVDAEASAFASASATEQAAEICMASSMNLSQALLRDDRSAPPLWFVSRGARMVSGFPSQVMPVQALQSGFARSLEAEHPEFRITCVDLDPRSGTDIDGAVTSLIQEISVTESAEPEVAWRDGRRYVRRLAHLKSVQPEGVSGDRGVRLVTDASRLLEGLALRPLEPAEPGPDDIEIQVEATGLNFRDVLNALGMMPGTPMLLGGECAGRVRRVGANVQHFAVGDQVMAFAIGSFASRVIVDARRAVALPPGIDTRTAAGIPIAFLTAMFALKTLALLENGERVLVHAGAGGVGMAAIQIALRAGAEVFATAGMPQKRHLLKHFGVTHVMDSRTLDFADEIRRITGGEGVQVVLNSLTGEFTSRSLDVLAPGGRFLELGKRDIRSSDDIARVRPDIVYQAFDLADIAVEKPAKIAELLAEMSALLAEGALQPLPTRCWPLGEAASAFRHMAQAQHTGKIVLTHEASASPALELRSDGCYLISGGLGGLGLETARWMIARGARNVVLAGRSLPDEATIAAIEGMREAGATVWTETLDITNDVDLAKMIRRIAERGHRLRGIVHAAGVLDDGVILEQNWARASRVLAPKVLGALGLARQTRGEQLDFFVCYSSATGIFGSPGQSSYSAANAYLDAFCHALRSTGVLATSVQWGPWRDVGMAAKESSRNVSRLQSQGVRPMAADAALSALETAIASRMAEVAVVSVDWKTPAMHDLPIARMLSEKADEPVKETRASPSAFLQLRDLAPSARRGFFVEHARASALRILGHDSDFEIEVGSPLREYGLNSLGSVELRNALARLFECKLPATLAFDHPTLSSIAEYLERLLFPAEAAVASSAQREATAIGALSEAEAEALLLAELNAVGGKT